MHKKHAHTSFVLLMHMNMSEKAESDKPLHLTDFNKTLSQTENVSVERKYNFNVTEHVKF